MLCTCFSIFADTVHFARALVSIVERLVTDGAVALAVTRLQEKAAVRLKPVIQSDRHLNMVIDLKQCQLSYKLIISRSRIMQDSTYQILLLNANDVANVNNLPRNEKVKQPLVMSH